jgi:hypothetical protein
MKDEHAKIRRLTRSRIGHIWHLAQLGAKQEGEKAVTAQILKQHPEYFDVWDQANTLPSDEEILRDGVNPFAHVAIHQTVEKQIADRDPPQVAQTLDALMLAGYERHDAIHAIGTLVSDAMFETMKTGHPFDESGYTEALRELGQRALSRPRPPRHAKRKRRKR